MPTRKETLFNAKKRSVESNVIPATISFRHNKKKGFIEPLTAQEKMLCALRKVLADLSDANDDKCRYFIANNKVQILKAPSTTAGKAGEAQSYHAKGRFRAGVCLPNGNAASKILAFEISYRDIVDDRGLADVEYFDPTVIDELPKNTPLDMSALS
jgi:hypothetical protein